MFKHGLVRVAAIQAPAVRSLPALRPAPLGRAYSTASEEAVAVTRDVNASGQPTGVVTITLNRPKTLNALTVEMGEKFRHVVETLKADESVRAVVLTGSGRAFSAGGDMKFLKDRMIAPPQRNSETMRFVGRNCLQPVSVIANSVDRPVQQVLRAFHVGPPSRW